jgi:adenylate cyclase
MARTDAPHRAFAAVLVVSLCAVLAALSSGGNSLRETSFDWMLQTTAVPDAEGVRVVAIDSSALASTGPWPWPRDRLAELIERVGADRPRVIVLDMLLEGPGRAGGAVDPDAALVAAIEAHAVVLGALLNSENAGPAPVLPPPVMVSGTSATLHLWQGDGAIWPLSRLALAAAGIGFASLSGDATGTVRDVPILVVVDGTVYPGLATEAVRVAEGAAGYIVAERAQQGLPAGHIGVGGVSFALPRDGNIRFRPSGAADWAARTVSARDVLAGSPEAGAFAGQIVLVGGTAPELGTLRPTAASPITPGVQITADAVAAMLSGSAPLRPDFAQGVEAMARALLAVAGLLLGWRLPPGRSVAIAGMAGGLWVAGCLALLHGLFWLIDPVSPTAALIATTLIAATANAVVARRRASAVVTLFGQHLAPEIVDRIVRQPGLSRVEGERRVVTFLFTDIEGFTAMSAALPPETVVRLLDDYFHVVTTIIADAGGTVDKYVGDAAHAMFNAPNDLADHATRAIEAAHQISRFTEDFRARPAIASLGLGRTRIGIETGEVIVGDVGGSARRDYTAHGTAINTAARLEALNARLGTAICVGPAARAAAPALRFVSHGVHDLKGLGPVEVFEPLAD